MYQLQMKFLKYLKKYKIMCLQYNYISTNVSYFSTTSVYFKVIPKHLKSRTKSSQDWLTRHLNDPYVKLAKIGQYRARSAFKLIEIDDKYKLLKRDQVVLDLGAAPGAWTQVIAQRTKSHDDVCERPLGKVIGVDLLTFSNVSGAVIIPNRDFTSEQTQLLIRNELQGRKIDLVLSDMAPNASGNAEMDHERIMTLALSAFHFATDNSGKGGHFLCKLWDGHKTEKYLHDLNQYYTSVKIVKPKASRTESSEIFVLAKNLK